MILDPYGRILAATCQAGNDVVIADLDGSLIDESTGKRWIVTRRVERDARAVRPDRKGN